MHEAACRPVNAACRPAEPGVSRATLVGMGRYTEHDGGGMHADWSDVAMAAIAATVLVGMPAIVLLFR